MTIADTDVLIDFLGGHEPGAEWVRSGLEGDNIGTTVISRFELLCGAKNKRQAKLVYHLLDALPTLKLDSASADHAARVRLQLGRKGQDIGMGDSLIAGIVIAHSGVLLTRNRRHFEPVEGLQLADSK